MIILPITNILAQEWSQNSKTEQINVVFYKFYEANRTKNVPKLRLQPNNSVIG